MHPANQSTRFLGVAQSAVFPQIPFCVVGSIEEDNPSRASDRKTLLPGNTIDPRLSHTPLASLSESGLNAVDLEPRCLLVYLSFTVNHKKNRVESYREHLSWTEDVWGRFTLLINHDSVWIATRDMTSSGEYTEIYISHLTLTKGTTIVEVV
ncbi:hypothetical protein TNCV_1325851 [Trichonephila clavipes]|nr:hypothetical protein TNCV_1325851 [Trichonephila clavipes]